MSFIKIKKANNGQLIQELMDLVFKKAEEDSNESKAYGISRHISLSINEKIKERTLTRYFDGYIKKEGEKNKPNKYNLDLLSQYIGCKNYTEFTSKRKANPGISKNKKLKLIGSSAIAVLMSYYAYDTVKKECMVWTDNNHYELISCEKRGELNSIPENAYLLENFLRVEPDCIYPFFKIDGTENLWYEKNAYGKLEYFTFHGEHPVTRETLKKITPYMIKKYICNTYK